MRPWLSWRPIELNTFKQILVPQIAWVCVKGAVYNIFPLWTRTKMHPTKSAESAEYQAAVAEAANAFMKVMALRGFAVRDYPQNFVAHMSQHTRLHFENSRAGAHPQADELVSEFIRSGQAVPRKTTPTKAKTIAFPVLRRRTA